MREHVENKSSTSALPFYEVIGSDELATRLAVPASWVRDQVRRRAVDPIPCLRLGRYVRFQWGSPELLAWIQRRKSGAARKSLAF